MTIQQFPEKADNGSATRILVTGGNGMLGSAVAVAAKRLPGVEVVALGRNELDVRDPQALSAWSDWVAGGWIFHCAAIVDVERCNLEPEACRATLVEGARNVAEIARAAEARVFYPQSFLIYGNCDSDISESQVPAPLSRYGRFKYEAEQLILERTHDPLIVRMAGFFGGEHRDKNFVGRIIPALQQAMAAGQHDFAIGDRIWQPTWTNDLARNALALIENGKSGHYQMACHGEAAFCEIGQVIVQSLGWSDRLQIRPVSASAVEKDMSGSRPARAVLSCTRLRSEGLDLQRPWRDTLREYLAGSYFNAFRETVLHVG